MTESNKILIISDIHANLTALDAVLAAAQPYDETWCLGDLVGYGPDPNEVVERIIALPNLTCLLGNHDAAVIEKLDISAFNFDARMAILWTREAMNEENIAYLQSLPELVEIDDFTLVHGSPRFYLWEYLLDINAAAMAFEVLKTAHCVVGHSHIPIHFSMNGDDSVHMSVQAANTTIHLQHPTIINPGSVGQPRDQDPRAAYAILDRTANTWTQHRVEYDVRSVQQRIQQAGLATRHAQRLKGGW